MSGAGAAAGGLVRVYPATAPTGVGFVWAHGGGFAAGDLDMPEADGVARALAEAGITVVSVDYRLVGDGCRYPAPSDDILTAWEWTLAHREALGIRHLAIGGASAGANLATGATLRLLHGERPDLALPDLVVLAYPTLHAVQAAPGAELRRMLDENPQADRFGPEVQREMYEGFLGGPVEHAPVAAVPGTATRDQLVGFPPTFMINDDIDELRVSGESFAAALTDAGVEVDVSTSPGTAHGHLNRGGRPAATTLARFATRLNRLA